MLDILQIVFLLATCAACYIAGTINGASGFAKLLLTHNIITQKELDKLQYKIENED